MASLNSNEMAELLVKNVEFKEFDFSYSRLPARFVFVFI